MSDHEMQVVKRNGDKETVSFDKILQRIKKTGQDLGIQLNYTSLAMKVIDQIYDGITTVQLDELAAEQCASLISTHPDYNALAAAILISNHQKNTSDCFSRVMTRLYEYTDKQGNPSPLVSRQLKHAIDMYADYFDAWCDYSRDLQIDYFGFKTLDRAYLLKINKKTVERPQHMWMRVAIGIHYHAASIEKIGIDRVLSDIQSTYDMMSQKYFTHATPTLFNAGTPHPQLSSCFLLALEEDSIGGIYRTLGDCAEISKWAGGIGLHIHNVRAKGSYIRGTGGSSNGIVPMLRVFNNTAKYVDQCVTPGTPIYTSRGPIPISQCVAGSTQVCVVGGLEETEPSLASVMNDCLEQGLYQGGSASVGPVSDGTEKYHGFETIEKVIEHPYDGPLLNIRTHLPVPPLQITPEHPVHALKKGARFPEWIEAKDLCVGDSLVFSSLPEAVKDYDDLSEELCYLVGVILRGLYGYDYRGLDSARAFQHHEAWIECAYPDEWSECAIDIFEKYNIQYRYDAYTNVVKFLWPTHLLLNRSDFYSFDKGEHAIGERWLYLPVEKSLQIIAGFLLMEPTNALANALANGSKTPENPLFKMGRSGPLVETMGLLYLRCGLLEKCVSPKIRDSVCFFCTDAYLVQIASILETEYTGVLYDLQMKTTHNYALESGLVHNGGGKRNGSFAIYLEPWHADVEAFLQMRKNHGDEELKARDLFYALWIPDLFMERVKADESWTLMCPDECPGLADVWGDEFVALYIKYEAEGRGKATVKARALWFQILDAQMETGTPYLLYKDACNRKSNQQNLGTIKSSNLCTEVVQYSDHEESAVCNLASIALPAFVETGADGVPRFDFDKLHAISRKVTYNLNCVIDVNYYPTEKTRRSNQRHRPIGIGIQGLADVFFMMGHAFASQEARDLNRLIFETIYHGALEESCALSQQYGSYETYAESPASQGILQFDMWNVVPDEGRYDWEDLKRRIRIFGLRNSLLLAPMPTASTSQILGYNECIEPITSNIYSRQTLAGEFMIVNRYLMRELIELGLWNDKIKNNIIANHGSVQHIDLIPQEIREKYKTVWEIPMKVLIDMAADRGAYICQSQSLNLWMEDPTYGSLTSMHFYGWSKGLKTGIYYLRRRGRHQAQQFTIEPERNSVVSEQEDICEMCSA